MPTLDGAVVRRKGEQARTWYEIIPNVSLSTKDESLLMEFKMPSKGGGTTEVQLEIPESSFGQLLRAMSEASRKVALSQMSLELTRQLSGELDRRRAFKWEYEDRILETIKSKRFSCRKDAKAKEKWQEVHSSVQCIFDEIKNEGERGN